MVCRVASCSLEILRQATTGVRVSILPNASRPSSPFRDNSLSIRTLDYHANSVGNPDKDLSSRHLYILDLHASKDIDLLDLGTGGEHGTHNEVCDFLAEAD